MSSTAAVHTAWVCFAVRQATFGDTALLVVKAAAMLGNQAGNILADLRREGFAVTAMQTFVLEQANAEEFLEVYKVRTCRLFVSVGCVLHWVSLGFAYFCALLVFELLPVLGGQYMHVCACAYVCACVYVCVRTRMCGRVCSCMCACVRACVCVHLRGHV